MKNLRFLILILVAILNSFDCNTSNKEDESNCCLNTTNQRVVVEFSSNVVQHEYIVQFKKYHQADKRAELLKEALEKADVI